MEQVNLKPAGGGPSRGGVGGPCDHCARTSSPCWRKGPPEKPLLCNACGAHYLVKKSLEGYKPGQKQARPTGSSPARPRSRPKKKPSTVDPPTPDSPFASSAGGSAKKGAAGEGSAATSKRQRKANKKYLAGEGEVAESEEGNATQRSSISHRKPKGLTIRRVSRQDSMAEIVDTPMAANLLADMADRRKNQAPPPVWELTSPRGIEGARQRTFNALMCSPRSNRRMSSDGMEANAAVCPPPAPQHQHHQQNQPPLSPSMPVPHANGSAILAEHPYAKRTVLYSYDTPLGLIEMTDVVNGKTWRAISTLAHSEASALSTLLPECDRSVEPGSSHAGVSSDLFNSAAFQSAMSNFQNLLSSGMFDREGPNAGGSKVVDHFRRLHTETNLSASNWRETMPLVGKRRRAAKKRAADEYQALLAAKQSGSTSTSSASPASAPISAPEAQPPVDLPPSPHSLTTAVPILRGEAAVVAAPLIQRPAFHPAAPSALTPEASFLNAEPKPEAGTFGDGMPPGLNSAAPLRSNAAGQSSATVPSPTTPLGGGEPPHPQQQQRQQQGSEAKASSANLARMGSDLLCST